MINYLVQEDIKNAVLTSPIVPQVEETELSGPTVPILYGVHRGDDFGDLGFADTVVIFPPESLQLLLRSDEGATQVDSPQHTTVHQRQRIFGGRVRRREFEETPSLQAKEDVQCKW